eukprot:5234120-Pyramimonas_sp.AAC.1
MDARNLLLDATNAASTLISHVATVPELTSKPIDKPRCAAEIRDVIPRRAMFIPALRDIR